MMFSGFLDVIAESPSGRLRILRTSADQAVQHYRARIPHCLGYPAAGQDG